MRNMDLDSLAIFKAVVDFGGISKAAAHLNRVQSNVTTRVKDLEARLGVLLFQRQSGKLVLSSEGSLLLAYAERLLRLSDEAESALRSGTPRGSLRIGAMESTAAARLSPLLSRYHQDFPDVQIELSTGTSGALLGKVRNFELEAAFVAEPPVTPELDMLPAFMEELVLIGPRNTPPVKTPKDLRNRSLIVFSAGCSYRRILEQWFAGDGVVPERVLELGSYHAIVACVAAGAGVGIMPRSVLEVVHAQNEIAVSTLPAALARIRTCLIWPKGHSSVALDAMRAALAQTGGASPGADQPRPGLRA